MSVVGFDFFAKRKRGKRRRKRKKEKVKRKEDKRGGKDITLNYIIITINIAMYNNEQILSYVII